MTKIFSEKDFRSAERISGAFDVVNPAKPHPLPVTLITENLRLLPLFLFIINTILFSKTRVSNPSKVSSPTGSGVPILLPAILVPDQPRSIGLIFITLNPPMESRSFKIFFSLSMEVESSGKAFCCNNSFPRIIGALRPGHNIFFFPNPITWPLFKSFAIFLPDPLPLPRFFPALLTAVTPRHKSAAGTEKNKLKMQSTF
uniref:Uncharacterized protein n=1 Tax=Glossina pallidipes TaxID=7398 RepID=A0A1A9ZXL2_GLOPL